MNERITSFYIVIANNEVVCFETNLKLFVVEVNKNIPESKNYDWFYRTFKKLSKFKLTFGDQEYFFQRLI